MSVSPYLNKYIRFILTVLVTAFMWGTSTTAMAEVHTISAVGEYTMSDYETPAIAEIRVLADAKMRAAEQAGVYVRTYTRTQKLQVTDDVISSIASDTLTIKSKKIERNSLPTGDIHFTAKITVEVDMANIERELRQNAMEATRQAAQYKDLKQAIEKQNREYEELKSKIANLKARNLPNDDLKQQAKLQELLYLSEQEIMDGRSALYAGNIEESLNCCKESIQLNPKNYRAYRFRSLVYAQIGKLDLALADCNRAISINGRDDLAYANRATIYLENGQTSKGIADFTHSLELKPTDLVYYVFRAGAYYVADNYPKAIEDLNRYLSLHATDNDVTAMVYVIRASIYMNTGHYAKARSDINAAMRINVRDVDTKNNVNQLHHTLASAGY